MKRRTRRKVKKVKIPLRTARAMVLAGLPVSRSELRGNQTPLERLRHYVSGGIARGERQAIVGHPKGKIVKVMGQSVRAGSNRYYILIEQKRQFDDLGRSELRGNPFDLPSQNELLRLKRADARGYAFTKKFSSKQPQALDMLISKLSMLKGNRDENLVTFLIRKRAKYPRDYIVILKHRKYVDGARVYSAGQKAEGAIGQFATILGAKAKRVGQSDFVFTSYGIRFPEERKKSSPGKLFGNPAKRDFYGDVYIGKKKVDTVFVRSIPKGSKRQRELDVMDELLSMPNSYKLAWVRKPNGLYDVRKGFRVRET